MGGTGPTATVWQIKIGRDISAVEEQGVQTVHLAPQPGPPVPGSGVLIKSR